MTSSTPPAGRNETRFADARATWDARYGRDEYILGTAPNKFLAAQASRLARGRRALCVADGEGRNGVWLAEQGLAVSAFDISPVGVEKARRLAASRGVAVDFEVNDVHGYAWPPVAFDVIAAIFVQFADPAARAFMFERMVRSLAPGGWLFVEGYSPRQLEYKTGGPPHVEHLYTPELLRHAFAGLEIVELREYDEEIVEGTQHVGMSALVDLVARKR